MVPETITKLVHGCKYKSTQCHLCQVQKTQHRNYNHCPAQSPQIKMPLPSCKQRTYHHLQNAATECLIQRQMCKQGMACKVSLNAAPTLCLNTYASCAVVKTKIHNISGLSKQTQRLRLACHLHSNKLPLPQTTVYPPIRPLPNQCSQQQAFKWPSGRQSCLAVQH